MEAENATWFADIIFGFSFDSQTSEFNLSFRSKGTHVEAPIRINEDIRNKTWPSKKHSGETRRRTSEFLEGPLTFRNTQTVTDYLRHCISVCNRLYAIFVSVKCFVSKIICVQKHLYKNFSVSFPVYALLQNKKASVSEKTSGWRNILCKGFFV